MNSELFIVVFRVLLAYFNITRRCSCTMVNWGEHLKRHAARYHGPAGHLAILHGIAVDDHAANDICSKVVEVKSSVRMHKLTINTLPAIFRNICLQLYRVAG